MKKVGVFYWSGSGNTEKMAEAIGAGLAAAGVEYD
ncbi:MAG: flavodoxin domain-containing protein, partial [Peptostreptococcus anaerobius]